MSLIDGVGLDIPRTLTAAIGTYPNETIWFNLRAMIIIGVITLVIAMGIRQTKKMKNFLVLLKIAAVFLFVGVAIWHVKPENWMLFAQFGFFTKSSSGESLECYPQPQLFFCLYWI